MRRIIIVALMFFALSSLGSAQAKKEQPKSGTKGTVSMVGTKAKATRTKSTTVTHQKSKSQQKATAKRSRMTKQIKSTKYAKSTTKKALSVKKVNKTASAKAKSRKQVGAQSVKKS